ncbi:hypothetical protein [Acinetobacter pollinis]|uniref:hypothetical protein n=2 Tax=Acinetobacter pollinis TaxID=2605270 RepID=UPI0018A2DE6E|nr:hypothetical protein [Acinetobacter pollinis]MBF7693654.1 hypothetical protein [Acinetobacter pollinis]MBF7699113.1 hypothetical protein [Acinetobacter pollinis]MBF7701716.1 hypothetical protein [Acinetobacter pollinis]
MDSQDIELAINTLYSYSGYEREASLRRLQGCFEEKLFSHLLIRLSDYVPINQQLAAEHLLLWCEKDNGSNLCIQYFLDIYAIQYRVRAVKEVSDALKYKISEKMDEVKLIIKTQQGALSRTLFDYILEKSLIDNAELLYLSENASDYYIRKYWISSLLSSTNNVPLLEKSFKQAKYVDVQKAIVHHMYDLGELSINFLIDILNSRYFTIIEFAIFVLKNRNFDFNKYFSEEFEKNLSQKSIKNHLLKIIILNLDKREFYLYFRKLSNKQIITSVLYRALKVKYLSLSEIVSLVHDKKIGIPWSLIKKIFKIDCDLIYIDELSSVSTSKIDLNNRLEIYYDLSFWGRIEWLTLIWKYCNTKDDYVILKNYVIDLLEVVKYEYYPPFWTKEKKQACWIIFSNIGIVLNISEDFKEPYLKIKTFLN